MTLTKRKHFTYLLGNTLLPRAHGPVGETESRQLSLYDALSAGMEVCSGLRVCTGQFTQNVEIKEGFWEEVMSWLIYWIS